MFVVKLFWIPTTERIELTSECDQIVLYLPVRRSVYTITLLAVVGILGKVI